MISHGRLGSLGHIDPSGIFNFALMNKQRGMRGRCSPAGSAALTLFICLLFVCYWISMNMTFHPSDICVYDIWYINISVSISMQRIRKETIIGGDVPRMHCLSDLYKWNESKQIQYLNTKTQTQTQQTRKGEGQVFPSWERDTHWPTTAGGESWKRGGEAPLIKHKH